MRELSLGKMFSMPQMGSYLQRWLIRGSWLTELINCILQRSSLTYLTSNFMMVFKTTPQQWMDILATTTKSLLRKLSNTLKWTNPRTKINGWVHLTVTIIMIKVSPTPRNRISKVLLQIFLALRFAHKTWEFTNRCLEKKRNYKKKFKRWNKTSSRQLLIYNSFSKLTPSLLKRIYLPTKRIRKSCKKFRMKLICLKLKTKTSDLVSLRKMVT
jgi:hypothetical protein